MRASPALRSPLTISVRSPSLRLAVVEADGTGHGSEEDHRPCALKRCARTSDQAAYRAALNQTCHIMHRRPLPPSQLLHLRWCRKPARPLESLKSNARRRLCARKTLPSQSANSWRALTCLRIFIQPLLESLASIRLEARMEQHATGGADDVDALSAASDISSCDGQDLTAAQRRINAHASRQDWIASGQARFSGSHWITSGRKAVVRRTRCRILRGNVAKTPPRRRRAQR